MVTGIALKFNQRLLAMAIMVVLLRSGDQASAQKPLAQYVRTKSPFEQISSFQVEEVTPVSITTVERIATKCKGNDRRKGSCQDGDSETVMPSTSPPTTNPSIGATPQPSLRPKGATTPKPSPNPTVAITPQPVTVASSYPSSLASAMPSIRTGRAPSFFPSSVPSRHPSPSPSKFPSMSPSIEPSLIQPSTYPSVAPSDVPTLAPTTSPSVSPTFEPTVQPSAFPSLSPSISMMPTASNFKVLPNDEGEDFVSVCLDNSKDHEDTSENKLEISYALRLVAGSVPENVLQDVQDKFRTTFSLYVCDLGKSGSRHLQDKQDFVSIEFSRSASFSPTSCPADPMVAEDCHVVDTEFEVTYLGSPVPDTSLVNALGSYFVTEMSDNGQLKSSHPNITGIDFRGFANVDNREFNDSEGNVGNEKKSTPKDDVPLTVLLVVVITAIAGIVLLVFLILRRRKSITKYDKHDDDVNSNDETFTGPDTAPELYQIDEVMLRHGDDISSLEGSARPPSTSTSDITEHSRQRGGEKEVGLLDDLGYSQSTPVDRIYLSPDTVDL